MFNTRKFLSCLMLLLFLSVHTEVLADVCNITKIRLGGQPGDAYIGPTCNNDGTYRSCFYITGTDLPAQNLNYQIRINGILYSIAFTVALSSTEVVICATGMPGNGTPNVSVLVQLAQGCSFLAPNLFTEPICYCLITGIRLGGQPGDAYIGPSCNNDGTYRTCFYITGLNLPGNNPDYQVTIDGVVYPIAFTVVLSPTEVVICVTGVPGDGTPASVTIQLEQGCSYQVNNLFTEPICFCLITSVRLGGQAGDAFIGPSCNNDGTYRTCFYFTGLNLPANNPNYQIIIDGIEYPIAFTQRNSPQEVVVCVTGIPADGTQGVPVYIRLDADCDFYACPLYNEPYLCPGGAFPLDPTSGPWNVAAINNSNGNAVFNPCNTVNFTVSASGFPSPSSDKEEIVYQDICGNAEIIVQVSSINNPGWAGIEMRESLTPGSKKATLKTQLGNFVRRDLRATENGQVQSQQLFRPQASWLKLIRNGSNIQGYTSVNGVSWQFAFSATLSMINCIKVGMFVESINVNSTTSAVFSNVTVLKTGMAPLSAQKPVTVLSDESLTEQWTDLKVYPNPAKDIVNIELAPLQGQEVEITIYTVEGRLVKNQIIPEVQNTVEQIELDELLSGTYLIRIQTPEKSLTKKLLVINR